LECDLSRVHLPALAAEGVVVVPGWVGAGRKATRAVPAATATVAARSNFFIMQIVLMFKRQ
jgi:hypothetical protein